MRYLSCLLVFLFLSTSVFAQLAPRFKLDDAIETGILTRLRPALQRQGVTLDTLASVGLSAEMALVDEGKIEAMQIRYTAVYDLLLTARIGGTAAVIATAAVPLQGTGSSPAQARQAAIRQLRATAPSLLKAVEQLKADYQQQLGDNCNSLLEQANNYARQDQLLIALALANSIPTDSPCYNSAQSARLQYYQSYQQAHCSQHLEGARRQMALQLPQAALAEIAKIDPASPCADEARRLLSQATATLQEQHNAKARFLQQVYQNQVQVETARTAIISDLIKE